MPRSVGASLATTVEMDSTQPYTVAASDAPTLHDSLKRTC